MDNNSTLPIWLLRSSLVHSIRGERGLGTVGLNSAMCLNISEVFCLYHLVSETGGVVPITRPANTEKSSLLCLRKQQEEEKEF